jgi:hypothetical protein
MLRADDEFPVKQADAALWEGLGIDDRSISKTAVSLRPTGPDPTRSTTDSAGGDETVDISFQPVVAEVAGEGSLESLAGEVRRIATPHDGLQTVDVDGGESSGQLTCRDLFGRHRAAVTAFAVGQGEVIVVGDARLLSNRLLAREDNSVLAVRLLLGDRQQVQFNEFYHGLSVRGNPLWLFTRRGYALLASVILAVVAVATWRSAVLLGPPLSALEPSRRTVAEYIDAMSQFLNRGRRTRQHLLQAVASGTLRRIAAEFGVSHNREDAATVTAAVARRDSALAARLRDATAAVDAVLAKHDKATEKETVLAMRQLQDCL